MNVKEKMKGEWRDIFIEV